MQHNAMKPKNKPAQIAGCQRSGTTLLGLMLDSHPLIKCIDETEFSNAELHEYLEHPDFHPCVVFKLPTYSHAVQSFDRVPGLKVIWCIRDPRDVVLSMADLMKNYGSLHPLSWANHPACAAQEISNCCAVLGYTGEDRLPRFLDEYRRIARKHPAVRNRRDAIYTGAVCWKLKHELLPLYDAHAVPYRMLHYEDLVNDPESAVMEVLQFLGIPWHENVLNHHLYHQGISVGNTRNTRPIDNRSIGKWKTELAHDELAIIRTLCADSALHYGYDLGG